MNSHRRACLALCCFLAACTAGITLPLDVDAMNTQAQEGQAFSQEEELGLVHWRRAAEVGEHDSTFAAASRDGKPVLLLFQEIPG